MKHELCCIGHITLDTIITPQNTVYLPGGTAFYFSHALARLDADYLLVTALAETEMEAVAGLRAKGIEVRAWPSAHTVVFENRYGHNPDERTQRVLQEADAFTVEQLRDVEAQVFHLGPLLANDIPAAVIKALAVKGKVSLDVQGFLRRVKDQQVLGTDWAEKKELLPFIHYLKANEEELELLTGSSDVYQGAKTLAAWGVKEVIITMGSRGSLLYSGERFYTIPAFVPARVTDATGCGDTYMAGYVYSRIKGEGLQASGEFAAAMASLKIEGSGPFTGTKKEVEEVLKKNRRAG